MAQSKWDIVVFVGTIIAASDKACLMKIDGEDVWMPNSQFKEPSIQDKHKPEMWTCFIPRWLAEEKDINYMEKHEWEDMQEEGE